jgi:hypothetical protein
MIFKNLALRITFGIADVDELTRWAFFFESTPPTGSVSESMWPRWLHDLTCSSNIMNSLSAARSGNAVLSEVAPHFHSEYCLILYAIYGILD